jgi:hypothetical protein
MAAATAASLGWHWIERSLANSASAQAAIIRSGDMVNPPSRSLRGPAAIFCRRFGTDEDPLLTELIVARGPAATAAVGTAVPTARAAAPHGQRRGICAVRTGQITGAASRNPTARSRLVAHTRRRGRRPAVAENYPNPLCGSLRTSWGYHYSAGRVRCPAAVTDGTQAHRDPTAGRASASANGPSRNIRPRCLNSSNISRTASADSRRPSFRWTAAAVVGLSVQAR